MPGPSDVDIASLSEEQQAALQQYTAVTDQDVAAAITLLRGAEWNVQIAISRFFDGEPATDPLAEALAERPQDARRQETLMNGFSSLGSRRNTAIEPAPRVVIPNDGQVTYRQNPLLGLVFMPVSIIYAVLSKAARFFGYLFPFLPRLLNRIGGTSSASSSSRRNPGGRIVLKPKDSALRLIREIEEEHGTNELPFFEDGYAQALDSAKRDLKFLLLILISPEHDDTTSFIRETLLDSSVVNYLKNADNNIIVWAGTVQDAEAYQVSTAMSCTKFPFSAMVCQTPNVSSTAMSIIARFAGPMTASTYLSKIQNAVEQHSSSMLQARRTRDEQNASRNIREQQNTAYERSLAQDRERARVKREEEQRRKEEEAAAKKAEEKKANYENNLAQWRQWRAATLSPEPPADDKEAVRISLRLLNGDRVIRKFASTASIEELYAFVECYDILETNASSTEATKPRAYQHVYKFKLVSPMPREAYELEAGGTVKDRIGRSGNLIVERTELESDDEADAE